MHPLHPDPPAYTTPAAPRNPGPRPARAALDVWLAPPEARSRFDALALTPAQRSAWQALRTERRRRDWETSRALQQAVAPSPSCRTSLSHSRGYAALAVGRGFAVGVDVEDCVPREYARLAALAYSSGELALVEAQACDAGRSAVFHELWVLKEACAKALGRPLLEVLHAIDFAPPFRGETPNDLSPAVTEWVAWIYAPRPTLRLAVFATGPDAAACDPTLREWPASIELPWPLVRRMAAPSRPLIP
jgi:hypothetical protein